VKPPAFLGDYYMLSDILQLSSEHALQTKQHNDFRECSTV